MKKKQKTVKYFIIDKAGRSELYYRETVEDLLTKPDSYFTYDNGYPFGKPRLTKVVTTDISDNRNEMQAILKSCRNLKHRPQTAS